ncbi:MAG TPA: FecR domain-containing protein, partial [Planctomycetota bacterium]|nr:FecR domain-containing protein [Planctomycetota bacterium]
PDDADYKPVTVGSELSAKSWLRTPPKSKIAVDFTDGTELRINENSEILVDDSHHVEVKVGDIYIVGARTPQRPFEVRTKFAPIDFTGGTMSVTFHPRDPNDPLIKTVSRTITMVLVAEGTATLGDKKYVQKLTQGYWCTLVDGTLNTPSLMGDISVPTRWVHELLVKRGKACPEIDSRLLGMLRSLGRYPEGQEDGSEAGYRGLGPYSPPYLVQEYLKYPTPPVDMPRRRAVVRIIADLGSAAETPALVGLLADADVDCRVTAAKGLERITGSNLKFDEAYWKGSSLDAGRKAWDEWLKKNPPPKK